MLNSGILLEKDNGDLQKLLTTFLDHKRRFGVTLRCLLTATKTQSNLAHFLAHTEENKSLWQPNIL